MRMDNETFRLKVENLFGSLRTAQEEGNDRVVMAELEQLAATPRKSRYFLKAVAAQEDPALQEHFYRLVFARVKSDQEASDLERHIRHMFYTNREEAKAMLARVATHDVLPALFHVIALTEEGWLAGELIRIVLAAPAEELYQPLVDALDSREYLIQCLAIYLIGKSGDDRHLHALARFYRKPVWGEAGPAGEEEPGRTIGGSPKRLRRPRAQVAQGQEQPRSGCRAYDRSRSHVDFGCGRRRQPRANRPQDAPQGRGDGPPL